MEGHSKKKREGLYCKIWTRDGRRSSGERKSKLEGEQVEGGDKREPIGGGGTLTKNFKTRITMGRFEVKTARQKF